MSLYFVRSSEDRVCFHYEAKNVSLAVKAYAEATGYLHGEHRVEARLSSNAIWQPYLVVVHTVRTIDVWHPLVEPR